MSAFTEAVKRHLADLEAVSTGFNCRCKTCRERRDFETEAEAQVAQDAGEVVDEGSFSWRQCDTCGSTLGGDRHDAHALDRFGVIVHMDVCTDCLMYLANGDEPENWEG